MRLIKISKANTFLVSIMMMAILLCCSNQVQAAQDEEAYTYTVTDGGVQITKYLGVGGVVSIPSALGGLPVTSIGQYAFYGCTGLTGISIPQGVTSINDGAFSNCTGLKTINIPQGVTSIGQNAFYGCIGLTGISIPQGVTNINNGTYSGCTGLTAISIPQGVTSIDGSAFAFCTSLTSITVADGNLNYASLNGVLFNKARTMLITCPGGLRTISIPQGVTFFGDYAFAGCNGLTTISIPQEVTRIGTSTFESCSSLTIISIPQKVTSIGMGAFSGCSSLTSISIPQGVTSIDQFAFSGCSSLTGISLPQGVTSIERDTFSNCTALTSINLPQGVTSIDYRAFSNCIGLKTINLLQGLTSIGEGAFSDCTGLTSINLPQGVTSIGEDAFFGCSSLTSINLPQGVTSIGEDAFSGCSSLTSISIPQGVTSIDRFTFSGCSSLTSINLPQGVTSIGDRAFQHCEKLTGINIPQEVTSIGEGSFFYCPGLTAFNIPQGVNSIGRNAFMYCSSLTSMIIPQGVTSIGEGAFESCTGLTRITFNSAATTLDDLYYATIIPLSTTIIGYDPSTAKTYATKYGRTFELIGDNLPTTSVSISSPSNNDQFTIGDTVTINGSGVNCDHIGLFVDGISVGGATINGNSYSYTYSLTSVGTHTIQLKGRDAAEGVVGSTLVESQIVTINVVSNTVAQMTITSPTPGNEFTTDKVHFVWNAVSGAHEYQLFFNNQTTPDQVVSSTSTSYDFSYPAGSYTFRIEAYNDIGQKIASGNVSFTVSLANTVKVTVTDSNTNEEISGATITLKAQTGTSDFNGYYEFKNITAGTYNISCERSGFKTFNGTFVVNNSDVDYPIHMESDGKLYNISGKVLNDTGTEPIQGATVTSGSATATTDVNGLFTLYNLEKGAHLVDITKDGYASQIGIYENIVDKDIIMPDINFLKPLVTASGIPANLTVMSGASIPLVGVLSCNTSLDKVTIGVVGFNGGLDGNGSIYTVSPKTKNYDLSNFNIDSNYWNTAFPEVKTYTLQIWAKLDGATEAVKVGTIDLDVTVKTINITGYVYRKYTNHNVSGAAVSGAAVNLNNSPDEKWNTTTDENGKFTFDGVRAGSAIYVYKDGYNDSGVTLESVATVDPSNEQTPITVIIPYVKGMHKISGRVANRHSNSGAGIPGVTVELLENSDLMHYIATTDQDGDYSFVGVGEGVTGITLSKEHYVDSDGKDIVKAEWIGGTTSDKSIPLVELINTENAYTLGGKVSYKDTALPYVTVQLRGVGQERFNDITDAQGNYAIYGVSNGQWYLDCSKDVYTGSTPAEISNMNNLKADIKVSSANDVSTISFVPNTKTIVDNTPLQMNPTINPITALNQKVSYVSSRPDIATVDENGIVTPNAQGTSGTTVITATTEDGGHTATCAILVNIPSQFIPVTGISMNDSTLYMRIDDISKMNATVEPSNATNRNIIWTSSNPYVASVDLNGNVTAHALGFTSIQAAIKDGENYPYKERGVIVTDNIVHVSSISILNKEINLYPGNEAWISYTIAPYNALNTKVTFEITENDQNAIHHVGDLIFADKPGTAKITATTEDGGFTETCTITVNPKITTTSLMSGTIGVPYLFTLATTGGTSQSSWSAVDLPEGLSINSSTGAISGTPTATGIYTVIISVSDGGQTTIRTYYLMIGLNQSNDATLSGITTSVGTLNPIFNPLVNNYTVNNLSSSTFFIKIQPTANDSNATVLINDNTSNNIALEYGTNIITVEVIAPDNITRKTYTITVKSAGEYLMPDKNYIPDSYVSGVWRVNEEYGYPYSHYHPDVWPNGARLYDSTICYDTVIYITKNDVKLLTSELEKELAEEGLDISKINPHDKDVEKIIIKALQKIITKRAANLVPYIGYLKTAIDIQLFVDKFFDYQMFQNAAQAGVGLKLSHHFIQFDGYRDCIETDKEYWSNNKIINPTDHKGTFSPSKTIKDIEEAMVYLAKCPIKVEIYDNKDILVGTISDDSPDVQYYDFGYLYCKDINGAKVKIAYIFDNSYSVHIVGTGSGSMNYSIFNLNHNGSVEKVYKYDNVPITSSTIIDVDKTNKNQLLIDSNADGNYDASISPVIEIADNGQNPTHSGGGGSYTPSATPTTVNGSVIDGTTGAKISNLTATVTTDSNGNATISMNVAQVILLKHPDGSANPLRENSRMTITSVAGYPVTISSDGTLQVQNLAKGTDIKFNISYDLGNSQTITIGTLDIKVGSNGEVSLTSTLIDPYGIITDPTTGKPIVGANVTLYYANTDRNKAAGKTPDTIVALPKLDGFKPNNNINPQVSDTFGAYGFMVFPASDYYILATKDGYEDYKSPTISVEQDLVKWNFKMNQSIQGVKRLAGLSRVDTALEIAKANYTTKLSNVVLATADNYPDALAGSVLAYKLNAPILLVGSSDADQEKVLDHIKLNVDPTGTVYLLGGTAVVSADLEAKVGANGFKNIVRLGGIDRYETAVKIADQLGVKTGTPIVLVYGENYPDALAISSSAAGMQSPILLVQKDGISDAVKQKIAKIKPSKVYIIGGTGVISTSVESEVSQITSLDKTNIVRIAGADRYETSLAVAQYFNLSGQSVCVATGDNFPDALAGSVYAANHNASIILAGEKLSDQIMNYLKTRQLTGATLFGGEAVVSKDIEQQLGQLIGK